MKHTQINRRQFTAGAAVGLASAALGSGPASAQDFGGNALIEAAKKEGRMVYYTADFSEPEQEIIRELNKRFPFVKVEMVRAPGGQLITRVKTEAAAGKLAADVIDHSDRALMKDLVDLFQDYAPPNAADYNPDVLISPKLWPRVTLVWSIAYTAALVRGDISIAPLLYNIVYPTKRDGAPLGIFFAPEGAPTNPYASGVPKTAAHPNAAKLFLNWCLSEEGQAFLIKDQGT